MSIKKDTREYKNRLRVAKMNLAKTDRHHIYYRAEISVLTHYLMEIDAQQQSAAQSRRRNLVNVRQRRVELGQARDLLSRSDENGIDMRFLSIANLLADWGFATRPLMIKFGCTDRDVTQWKRDKLIVAGMEAYRPSPYAQTKVAVAYYSLAPKGQAYLKKHHPIWNGLFEQIYRDVMKEMDKEPVFTTPKINAIAPQSFYFEHDIAALCCAMNFMDDPVYQNMYLFGRALIKAKINHVLGLPIPKHREAWQYDAILCALPSTKEEIMTNQRYYRYWEEPLKEELAQKLAEIDEEEKRIFNFDGWGYYFSDMHIFDCQRLGISIEEDMQPLKEGFEQQRQDAQNHYASEVSRMEKAHPNRAMILEFERSKKKDKELDNFVAKMASAVRSDATPTVICSSKALGNSMMKHFEQATQKGWGSKWHRRTDYTEYGKSTSWVGEKIYFKDLDKVEVLYAESEFINDFAGFAFRRRK